MGKPGANTAEPSWSNGERKGCSIAQLISWGDLKISVDGWAGNVRGIEFAQRAGRGMAPPSANYHIDDAIVGHAPTPIHVVRVSGKILPTDDRKKLHPHITKR